MRAAYPHTEGYATNPTDGVRIFYEVFGPRDTERTILFLPTWTMVHSRIWKAQVPYCSRSGFRVVTFDNRGNGKSDRPANGYSAERIAEDALAVMDATSVERTALVGFSAGGRWAVTIAAEHPERVTHLVLINTSLRLYGQHHPGFDEPYDGTDKYNASYWRQDYPGFLEYWAKRILPEPHSTKQREDVVAWGLETSAEILTRTVVEGEFPQLTDLLDRVQCPTLILHGSEDQGFTRELAESLQEAITGSELVELTGCGHTPLARQPVKTNLLLHDFLGPTRPAQRTWQRAMTRHRKRALFVSSPIGLGHVQRDLAIADSLRQLEPNLEIDWLTQDPVTQVLERRGERLNPMSVHLAGESSHVESECIEHDLPLFKAWRRMDEILLANFMVFHDAVKDDHYDLWVADEGWDVDYYLHENPELKRAPVAWLTDFVGWLPMQHDEEWLTADYNAEMIEQVERFPRVRDRSIFVGNPDDVVPDAFGPGLPPIREWTEANFTFPGYVLYFDPARFADRSELRERLGFHKDERVVFASVGGTGVGRGLLERIIQSFPEARRRVPGLRMVVVAGPRIDPASLPQVEGIEYRGYVHNLYEHFAACDLALVQGGMSTTMELVATGRPFLYFPLRNHFEQNFHVAHRLTNYGVGPDARIDFEEATPDRLANLIVRSLGCTPEYRPVETDGAQKAARMIAELL